MSNRNQLDLNCVTDVVAVISQLKYQRNLILIGSVCHLITPFYLYSIQ